MKIEKKYNGKYKEYHGYMYGSEICDDCNIEHMRNHKLRCSICGALFNICYKCYESNVKKSKEAYPENKCKPCCRNIKIDTLTQINY